jgi:nucleoside-diphosphate-sugar epimerase
MKILITGVDGFIGHRLADLLISNNNYVVGLGRRDECSVKNIHAYFSGDILDEKLVEKAVSGVDAIIHLASLTSYNDIIYDKFKTLEINLFGTKNVLNAFVKSKSAKKFIYSSSGKVYGDVKHLPISDEQIPNPLNILGKSKLITEKLIDFYSTGQKEFIIFRIFNVYGPGQQINFLIPTILSQVKESENDVKTITLGNIKAKRDYVFIDDVVDAFVLAIEKNLDPGLSIFNICSGKGISAQEIVSIIENLMNIQINIKTKSFLIRNDETDIEYGSFEKAKKILGWYPKYSFRDGIKKVL